MNDKCNNQETLRSRVSFTRTLEKICSRLDKKSAAHLDWKDDFLDKHMSADIEALSLWVVGSYARGA